MKRIQMLLGILALTALLAPTALLSAEDFDATLAGIQRDWAVANYQTEGREAQEKAFEALVKRAEAFVEAHPQRAEPLVWQGIVFSTYAGVKGGLGALGLARKSRDSLEAAIAVDDTALDGSAYTSLGTLYHKVPGFPIGFGSDKKARRMLGKALELNPDGIDPNYFYGEFLYDRGQYGQALEHLRRALDAPPRPGRPVADNGRRGEIEALLAKVRVELDRA